MPKMSKGMKAAFALRGLRNVTDAMGIENPTIVLKDDGIEFDMFTALGEAVSDLIDREPKDKLKYLNKVHKAVEN